uniref:Uncharacterized protein n=1 Tax=Rhizophagus irregularis (strain DAOM 181602 / DAOM 197198 / MUCL 43194) TaxID=747089 RepID=U9TXZ6_RHIID
MIQETITHQDGTANNTQSSQLSQKKLIFGNVLKFKMNSIRRKNDKLKYQLEECNNKCSNSSLCSDTLEEDQNSQLEVASSSTKTLTSSSTSVSSSSEIPLPVINESQPVVSTSVISFSDRGSIKPESTANSSTKSASLFSHFPWNYSSILKHKSSTTSDASTTINNSVDNSQEILVHQENPVDSTKKKKKLFSFSKLSTSIESSDMDQNDSAYETETDSYCCMKKKEKKGKKKSSKSIKTIKTIRRTKLKTLSPKDEEYIEIKKLFQAGLPNKNILGIIRLQMPTRLIKAHEQFKRELAQNNITSESQICHRMFHGTKTAFIFCGIVQEGNKTKYSRYNQRMWFANNSATSLSYCSSNNVKAMFVVDVVSTSPNSILIIEKDEELAFIHFM